MHYRGTILNGVFGYRLTTGGETSYELIEHLYEFGDDDTIYFEWQNIPPQTLCIFKSFVVYAEGDTVWSSGEGIVTFSTHPSHTSTLDDHKSDLAIWYDDQSFIHIKGIENTSALFFIEIFDETGNLSTRSLVSREIAGPFHFSTGIYTARFQRGLTIVSRKFLLEQTK